MQKTNLQTLLKNYWILFLGPVLLLGPLLIQGQTVFWGTASLQFIPWWTEAANQVRQGVLPYWNTLNGMGAPLIANYQIGFFYPPNWILLILGLAGGDGRAAEWIAIGYTFLAMLHLIWAGLGMALFLRRLSFPWVAQVLGGLAFGLSGYLVGRIMFYCMVWVAAWLPWILLFSDQLARSVSVPKTTKGPNVFLSPGLVLCLAMQLLAGHAQLCWYTLLLAFAWLTFVLWQENATQGPRSVIQGWLWGWGSWGICLVLAVGISAVQLVPTFEYLQLSPRASAVNYEEAVVYSFWPWRFLTLLAPDFFGDPMRGTYWGYTNFWESHAYQGTFPFWMALATLFLLLRDAMQKRKNPRKSLVIFLWISLGITFVLALGQFTPVFPFLYRHVPSFAMFQAPARYLILATFAVPLLTAVGLERLSGISDKVLFWVRLGCAAAVALAIGAGFAALAVHGVKMTFLPATALTGLWLLGCGLLIVARKIADRKGWLAIWEYAVIGWTLLDLLVTGWTLNPGANPSFLSGANPTNGRISGRNEQTRVYLSAKVEDQLKFKRFLRFQDFSAKEDWIEMRSVLLPNLNLIDRVALLNNFDPLVPDSYFRWKQIVDHQNQTVQSGWLAWLGVGAVEQIDPSQPSGVRFDLLSGASRWHWYSCQQSISNPDEIWKRIEEETSREIQGTRAALMEGNKDGLVGDCSASLPPTVIWKTDLPGKMALEVSTDQDGWLEVMDIWYPGWTASLDGKTIPLEKADGAFMAVLVPSGSHQVLLEYHPSGFIFINLLSILIVLFVIVLMTRLGRKRVERPSS